MSTDSPQADGDDRPCLVMVANTLTPYRVNLHRVLARDLPAYKLLTLVTHGAADFRWDMELPSEIHVSFFDARNEPAHGGVLSAPYTDWKKGAKLIRFLDGQRVAAVILTGYGYPSHIRLLRWLSRRGTPFFLRNDANIYVEQHRKPWRRWIKRRFFAWASRHAAGVMPMGDLGEMYFASYGFPKEKMYRVPYTPDYDWFASRDEQAVERVRSQLGLPSVRRRLIYSGRLVPVKRVDLVIDAFASIAERRPDWDLVIAGTGPLEEELRKRASDAVGPRVIWTGFLEVSNLCAVYHACDALVLASRREAWGVVVQEAMAAGLPVVASSVVGSAHDLVEDGVSGRIFEDGSLSSLSGALLDITDGQRLSTRQSSAKTRLAAWRREVDVVEEVRRALNDAEALAVTHKRP